MNLVEDHVVQAHHNEEFLETINPAQFPDWVITACFYAAVHWVEATIHAAESLKIRDGRDVVTLQSPVSTDEIRSRLKLHSLHQVRRHILLENKPYFNCYSAYCGLMEKSHASRYKCYRGIDPSQTDVSKGQLATVRDGVAPRLPLAPSSSGM